MLFLAVEAIHVGKHGNTALHLPLWGEDDHVLGLYRRNQFLAVQVALQFRQVGEAIHIDREKVSQDEEVAICGRIENWTCLQLNLIQSAGDAGLHRSDLKVGPGLFDFGRDIFRRIPVGPRDGTEQAESQQHGCCTIERSWLFH